MRLIGRAEVAGTHGFIVEDSAGDAIEVSLTVSFVCGNGVARGDEQCDLGDLRGFTCEALGFLGGTLLRNDECRFDTANCQAVEGSPGPGTTPTGVTPTPTPAPRT